MTLEVLNCAFVSLRSPPATECTKVASLTGLRVHLAGIEAVLAGLEFADHGSTLGRSIMEPLNALVLRAMCAAKDLAFGLHPMSDHTAVAVGATRRQSVDGTLKAIERHGSIALGHTKGLVVVISANIAAGHKILLWSAYLSKTTGIELSSARTWVFVDGAEIPHIASPRIF